MVDTMIRSIGAGLLVMAFLAGVPGNAYSADGTFKGQVVATWDEDGRNMKLLEPFGYVDRAGVHWDVPIGAIVNGASIPRFLWSIVGAPFIGKFRKAAVVHDFHCENMSRDWRDVHRMFFEAAIAEGNGGYHSKLLYAGVLAWGPRWEVVNGVPMRLRAVVLDPNEQELESLAQWIRSTDPPLEDIQSYVGNKFPRKQKS